jgi:phage-related protein
MVWILDDIGNLLTQIYNFVISIPDLLIDMISGMGTLILYPITAGIGIIINIMNDMVGHLTGPVQPIIGLQTGMLSVVGTILGNLLPFGWVSLITAMIVTIVCIRLYHFVKDISIFGWKL